MSLSDWVKPNRGYESATATDATEEDKWVVSGGSVAPVASVAVAEPRKLKPIERAYLLNWCL